MDTHIIKNFTSLATSGPRQAALEIAETGLRAINTTQAVNANVKLEQDTIIIKGHLFNLKQFKNIYLIGFGKASCDAILALNEVLAGHISSGIAIDIKTAHCDNPNIQIFQGTHPKPTPANFIATQEILSLGRRVTADDLVICIVSGGGSALLCATEEECDFGSLVYDRFLSTGGNINELNTLRKHLSPLKGGGLAKLLYPATIIGLVFSDIPGGQIEDVASGPTFFDRTTLDDVKTISTKYRLHFPPKLQFTETPKDDGLFSKVTNILLVSNHQAVAAMVGRAKSLGFETKVYSETTMENIPNLAKNITSNLSSKQARIGGGEPSVVHYSQGFGKGGRCQQLALETIPYLEKNQVFIALASDGVDNSKAAGAVADGESMERIKKLGLDYTYYKQTLNSFELFSKLGDLLETSPTGSNVSDLMLTLKV